MNFTVFKLRMILFYSSLFYCIVLKKAWVDFKKKKRKKENVVFPGQAKYSYFSADFRLKIFMYYSQIIASGFAILECIGV